jgi:hypothetical protein
MVPEKKEEKMTHQNSGGFGGPRSLGSNLGGSLDFGGLSWGHYN